MSTKVSQPGQGVSAGPAAFAKNSSQTSRPGGFRLSTQFGKSASQVSLSPETFPHRLLHEAGLDKVAVLPRPMSARV